MHRGINEFKTDVNMDMDDMRKRVAKMQDQSRELELAVGRLDRTLLGVVERVDLLGGSFAAVFDRLIKHLRDHGEDPKSS